MVALKKIMLTKMGGRFGVEDTVWIEICYVKQVWQVYNKNQKLMSKFFCSKNMDTLMCQMNSNAQDMHPHYVEEFS